MRACHHRSWFNTFASAALVVLVLDGNFGFNVPSTPHMQPNAVGEHYWDEGPELFSVAPMMAHTNCHYRFFYGQISKRAWLYTEMIPASRVVQSYVQAVASLTTGYSTSNNHNSHESFLSAEEIPYHVERVKREYCGSFPKVYDPVLEELLHPGPNPAVLQLGGRDPEQLSLAAGIAAAFGFRAVNLNCGCPSTSVSARATGAALMSDPTLVAQCLEAMSESIDQVNPSTILSVKHRLGVADVNSYDPILDHSQDDEEAHRSCKDFVGKISFASKLSRIQVHARIALLGFDVSHGSNSREDQLWVPSSSSSSFSTTEQPQAKINHQRVQYKAKRRARKVTLENRSVPPLRPAVVEQIARDFPKLQVSSNGGINCIEEIENRIIDTELVGAMVGRAAINHPCSFAGVDTVLWKHEPSPNPMTRRIALINYIDYCQEEESRLEHILYDNLKRGKESNAIEWHRKRLVAPIFHLFMGEIGNEAFQRRLRKLVSRADRHATPSMLSAAMAELPSCTLDKPLEEHVPWDLIAKYDGTKRSGAMQRTIY